MEGKYSVVFTFMDAFFKIADYRIINLYSLKLLLKMVCEVGRYVRS